MTFLDCAKNASLLTLTSDLSCNLLASCTGAQCCATSLTLQRTFEVYINIDSCTNSLSIQIEQLFYNHTLVDFQWGKIIWDFFDRNCLLNLESLMHNYDLWIKWILNFRCGTTFMAVWNIQSRVSIQWHVYSTEITISNFYVLYMYLSQFCTNHYWLTFTATP